MQLICHECAQSVSSEVPDDTILRAYLLCPECLEQVPDRIANPFLQQAGKIGRKRQLERLGDRPTATKI